MCNFLVTNVHVWLKYGSVAVMSLSMPQHIWTFLTPTTCVRRHWSVCHITW